jgi:ubiquitin-protein ligase E3 A
MFWFNPDSLESSHEYELIGIMLGLAIYNSVILDVHFPSVVYKKLMRKKLGLRELAQVKPDMAQGLKTLLEFSGDVKDTYMRTFEITTETVFGEQKTIELKKGGSKIPLDSENRKEYVDLYVDYVLNKAIEKQFKAFHYGFDLVCGGGGLKLFHWEELELLICGSSTLDFHALEEAATYDGGFDPSQKLIKDFWQIVHEMKTDDKKKLLQFTTGSDRVPIKGLGTLSFTISKQGPDSDQLPTSHTCFNHLLLPEYKSKEKLQRLLYLAISNAQGFGLL